MSDSDFSEPIDVDFELIEEAGEPALPLTLFGPHLRFIGWARIYTIRISGETMHIEGPFQDDQPNSSDEIDLSRTIASQWVGVRSRTVRLRIPGRGKWAIDVSNTPNRELVIARTRAWLANLRGEAATEFVRDELRRDMFAAPGIYSLIQLILVALTSFCVLLIRDKTDFSLAANGVMVSLFGLVYYRIALKNKHDGFVLGFLGNIGFLFLPLIETFIFRTTDTETLPFFVPFCFSPAAITVPLALASYLYAWLEYPRLRSLIQCSRFARE